MGTQAQDRQVWHLRTNFLYNLFIFIVLIILIGARHLCNVDARSTIFCFRRAHMPINAHTHNAIISYTSLVVYSLELT